MLISAKLQITEVRVRARVCSGVAGSLPESVDFILDEAETILSRWRAVLEPWFRSFEPAIDLRSVRIDFEDASVLATVFNPPSPKPRVLRVNRPITETLLQRLTSEIASLEAASLAKLHARGEW